jgi:hypothetical protein
MMTRCIHHAHQHLRCLLWVEEFVQQAMGLHLVKPIKLNSSLDARDELQRLVT